MTRARRWASNTACDMRLGVMQSPMACTSAMPASRSARSGPGTGERPVAPVYIDGEKGPTLKGERIAEEFQQLVEDYVERTYGRA